MVIVAAPAAYAATSSPGPSYRTAVALRMAVHQTLDSTGTISPALQSTVTFPVSGKVATVAVSLGQEVTAGQTLATLDDTALRATVDQDAASLAADRRTLATDEASQQGSTASVTNASSTGARAGTEAVVPTSSRGSTSSSGGNPQLVAARATVVTDQKALLAAQQAADPDLTTAAADFKQETTSCAAYLTASSGGAPAAGPTAPSGSPTPATAATPRTSPPANPSPGPTTANTSSTCSALLSTVLTDQQRVATDLTAVGREESTLGGAINAVAQLVSTGSTSSSGGGPGSSTPTGGSPATGGTTGGQARGSSTGTIASPAQLASDQAAIDAAQADVTQADGQLAQAALVSPITGTVGSVGLAVGASVSASSGGPGASNAVTIVGSGSSYLVTTSIPDTDLAAVKAGQAATVTVDGLATSLPGKVVSIGLLPTTSSSSSSASSSGSVGYPVTIAVDPTSQHLFAGSDADVSIVVSQADGAVAVPNSALHSLGPVHLVTVLRGGKATSTTVQVGAVGETMTQITAGVKAGEQVVLANLSTPLPTTTSASSLRGLTGGGGGFGGGGFGGGGFGGGAGSSGARG